MKEFQNLTITIDETKVDDFINYISGLSNNWLRDEEKEENVTKFTDAKMFCFNYLVNSDEYASLWLSEKEAGILYITNIVPIKVSSLSISEYNEVQKHFCNDLISRASHKFSFDFDLTKENIEIEDLLDEDAAKALRAFSNLANKSTGRSHPLDQERWFKFITLAYNSDKKITPEQLEKFLIEDGWDQNYSLDLACDFEYSIDLLAYIK
ncbi:hypothetical protein D0B83_12990 [Vibrio cholerae]|nr:hypothetical protein [Vibrio cholerae]EGR2062304.1 hypothetical protein [Vibrio cholerae]EGR2114966.1 hypothetical protein [Vibrio cholerae]EGR2241965.1 hypothetical protein [Vibrio cholerae]